VKLARRVLAIAGGGFDGFELDADSMTECLIN
jgi:hypothetical protein